MPHITFSRLEAITRGARISSTGDTIESPNSQMGSHTDPKRSRTANWRADEVKALVDAVEPVYEVITGPHSNTLTEQDKKREWLIIQTKVNAVSTTQRTLQACEAKWSDFKSRVKAKVRSALRQRSQTGGGESDRISMTEVEEVLADIITANEKKVMNLLGPTCLFGIDGGLDTSLPVNEQVPVVEATGEEGINNRQEADMPPTSNDAIRRKSPNLRTDTGAELLQVQKGIMESTQKMAASFGNLEAGMAETNKSLSRIATALEEILWFQKLRSNLDPNLSSVNYVVNLNAQAPNAPPS